ncbi:hypothetical protein [Paenibacillus terrigena]|nr:hypothetical protein [Paenibacillus terrigena]
MVAEGKSLLVSIIVDKPVTLTAAIDIMQVQRHSYKGVIYNR